MGQQELDGAFDLGVLRTPKGLLLGAELVWRGIQSADLLRAVSGTIIFLVVALVALAASRDALAATTFVSVILILSFLFAFDAFVTYRAEVAPAVGRAVGQREGVPPWLQCRGSWPAAC
uniref:Uncharacterized protein n=1 Tax=Strigops habroptila TaxID=2489341 RepID=A0A672VAT9_STRHB